MAVLSPAKQSLLNILRQSRFRSLEEGRSDRLAPVIRASGLGSTQIAESERRADLNIQDELAQLESKLLLQEEQERRQDELTGQERAFREKMTFAEYAQRDKELLQRLGQAREQFNRTMQLQREQFDFQKEQAEEVKKLREREEKKAVLKTLLGVGIGAATGGIAADAGILPGLSATQGALLGGLSGPQGVGYLSGYNFLQNANLNQGGGFDPNVSNAPVNPLVNMQRPTAPGSMIPYYPTFGASSGLNLTGQTFATPIYGGR